MNAKSPTPWLLAVLLGLVAAGSTRAELTEEIVMLPSAGDARLPVLVSSDPARPAKAAAVLFSGGGGAVGLQKRIPRPGTNFLVRSRSLFVDQGVATAVIDVPTDLNTMSDSHRMSSRHADDVRTAVAALRARFPGLPVVLIGTSRGTVSAAYAGAALGGAVDGVVLTSTVFNANKVGPGVSAFDWGRLNTRQLFVHHVDDGCAVTPYAQAQRVAAGKPLISAHGGEAPRSEPCEALSAHGYLGIEPAVVAAMAAWMRGETPPADVP